MMTEQDENKKNALFLLCELIYNDVEVDTILWNGEETWLDTLSAEWELYGIPWYGPESEVYIISKNDLKSDIIHWETVTSHRFIVLANWKTNTFKQVLCPSHVI